MAGDQEGAEESHTIKETLISYCDNTGVYTLKQITEPTKYKVRRFYWVAVLIAGFIMFSIQTYEAMIRYLSHESSVSMKINFIDNISFPAVTICNQNAFRATKVAEMGIYREVSTLYTSWNYASITGEERLRDLTLHNLYAKAGHNLTDLLVSCFWGESKCTSHDFVPVLTDFGMCYTFNMLRSGVKAKTVGQSGSEHALRLQLNIEQYEYMAGPNDGAGLRIYLHDQEKALPVKNFGKSIPPGSHAQVSAQIFKIENLKPPYGTCEDDQILKYHTQYTKHSCSVDCQEQKMVAKCGCREFFMPPSKTEHNTPRICTVQEHFNCAIQTKSENTRDDHSSKCRCPVPCKYTSVDSIVSYGSTSNFDMQKLLTGNVTLLKTKYLHAREVNQKVNDHTVASDTRLVAALKSAVDAIASIYTTLEERLDKTVHDLDEALGDIQRRARFHMDVSLEKVRYMIEYNFKRYWTVYNERAFNHVASDYYSLSGAAGRIVAEMANGSSSLTPAEHQIQWNFVETELLNKRSLIDRAETYIIKVNRSYFTGKKLGTYTLTLNKEYDLDFEAPELFQSIQAQLEEYTSELFHFFEKLRADIDEILTIGNTCLRNGTCQLDALAVSLANFESSCGRFNYYIFLLDNRVISIPLHLATERKDEFGNLISQMNYDHNALKDIVTWIKELDQKAKSGFWQNILMLNNRSQEYIQNYNAQKTDWAEYALSWTISESIQNTTSLLQELLSRGLEFGDGLRKVQKKAIKLYIDMVRETTTKNFYTHLDTDLQKLAADTSLAAYFLPIYEDMLGEKLNTTDYRDLAPRLNSDSIHFNETDLAQRMQQKFLYLYQQSDIKIMMGNAVEEFRSAVTQLRTSLDVYQKENILGPTFFRQNFLRLDVFLNELSYTEITQQVSYDMNNLLGDIGGSAGLFVGASLITLFEVIDLLCYGLCLMKTRFIQNAPAKPDATLTKANHYAMDIPEFNSPGNGYRNDYSSYADDGKPNLSIT